ncbi:DNA-binding response regulator [Stutzerimonas nosocomialis]|uniref:response regulator n=1 Tax=Stutzerimonas nosocomialis TaxID=1056496 RepID=UPI001108E459|nr:response regulator transcription factor [Stutzerimonas nosocomialis]TLX54423.1 DNA-binding response regulator [Stutzerimonas nosocomialis]
MKYRLLLADDHELIRAGVRIMIQGMEQYEIIAEAEDGPEAVKLAREHTPDIVILDISMKGGDGLEALRSIVLVSPTSKVLMLSMHTDAETVFEALQHGATGYLLKDAAKAELHLALRAVSRGERYLSSAIMQPVIAQALAKPTVEADGLTQRQIEILRLITRGNSTRTIAEGLGLSVKTVEAHRAQIMRRLDIYDVPGLVLYAVREKIISPDD